MCGWCLCLWSFGLGGWWWRKEAQTGEKVLALKRVVLAKGHVIYNKRTVVKEQHIASMNVGVEVEQRVLSAFSLVLRL